MPLTWQTLTIPIIISSTEAFVPSTQYLVSSQTDKSQCAITLGRCVQSVNQIKFARLRIEIEFFEYYESGSKWTDCGRSMGVSSVPQTKSDIESCWQACWILSSSLKCSVMTYLSALRRHARTMIAVRMRPCAREPQLCAQMLNDTNAHGHIHRVLKHYCLTNTLWPQYTHENWHHWL